MAPAYSRTTSSDVAESVSIAKRCAESDVSSPSASRTLAASVVATPRTWSLLEARSVALAITFPVTACVALTDTA